MDAMIKMPDLSFLFMGNIERIKKYYNKTQNESQFDVVVCGWELAHNSAGRAYTLAEIYTELTPRVQVVGCIFPGWGFDIWEPIRNSSIKIHAFIFEPSNFFEKLIKVVARHPARVVHLSKPRGPNILFGILYKILWGSLVIMDIDDEELGFVGEYEPFFLDKYIEKFKLMPPFSQFPNEYWTKISVGLINEFDGITVSNVALQTRYGGEIIAHARNGLLFKPYIGKKIECRKKLNIITQKKIVLFFGTPREHKGLVEIAKSIITLKRSDILLVIIGVDFHENQKLKNDLYSMEGLDVLFISKQPFSNVPQILPIADCCVIYQKIDNQIGLYQIPAKISDALGMCIPVICIETPALYDLINSKAVMVATKESLALCIQNIIDGDNLEQIKNGSDYFNNHLSISVNAKKLKSYIASLKNSNVSKKLELVLTSLQVSPRFKVFVHNLISHPL